MKDENSTELSEFQAELPSGSSRYETLVRSSKRLGSIATRALSDIKQVLHQEIALPSPAEKFMDNLARIPGIKTKKKKIDEIAALKKMVKQSHQVLARARTVFPMQLFPDRVVIDRTKITITKRDFFWTSNVIGIRIEDILNVSCSVGPLFGSINIASRVMSSVDHFSVNFLWRNDAIHLKDIIQGYMIAKHNKIDIAELSTRELVETLTELGHDADSQ